MNRRMRNSNCGHAGGTRRHVGRADAPRARRRARPSRATARADGGAICPRVMVGPLVLVALFTLICRALAAALC